MTTHQLSTPRAVILTAHVSRHPGSDQGLKRLADEVRQLYPDAPVSVAHIASGDFVAAQSVPAPAPAPKEVLVNLIQEGIRQVVVQSLHVIPGREFHEMLVQIDDACHETGISIRTSVGDPLLGVGTDIERVADAVFSLVPPERKSDQAVVLVGHGSSHPGHTRYSDLAAECARRDELFYIGSLGHGKQDGVMRRSALHEMLIAKNVSTVWLIPFFSSAGRHAHKDLFGDSPDSWQTQFEKANIACHPVLTAALDHPPLAALWLNHVQNAWRRLDGLV
ncbi:sirohydrochlorin cobaltochelatase [Desulfovibrio inopinatus]|uniref:sirohydrochlorin cobaltochelatase n=1 Tax=Desulfovibrio inopinatus TaxID=102109 RepID=UPI000404555A|nr:sirohydrochlorin cobaltochelatase [Desulfovibrio inopinatus]